MNTQPITDLPSLYASHMNHLKMRLNFISAILEEGQLSPRILDEPGFMALHFRKSLELIAFASLVANQELYSKVYADFSQHWNVRKLINNIERLHPAFYPRPVKPIRDKKKSIISLRDIKTGYLDKEGFIELYNICNMYMHISNPFKLVTAPKGHTTSLNTWAKRIRKLVQVHFVEFIDRGGIWLTDFGETNEAEVHVYIIEEN